MAKQFRSDKPIITFITEHCGANAPASWHQVAVTGQDLPALLTRLTQQNPSNSQWPTMQFAVHMYIYPLPNSLEDPHLFIDKLEYNFDGDNSFRNKSDPNTANPVHWIPLHPHLVPWLLTNYFKAESLLCSQLTSLPILSKSFLFSQQLHPTFIHYCPLSLIISSKFYHKKQEKTIQPLLKFPACSLTRLNIEQLNLLSSPVLFPICLQGLGHNLQWKWTDSQSMQLLKK